MPNPRFNRVWLSIAYATKFFDQWVNQKSLFSKTCDYKSKNCGTDVLVNAMDRALAKIPDCKLETSEN